MASKNAILIRSHFVDDHLLEYANSLVESGSYDVILALDESNKVIDAGKFPKLSVSLNSVENMRLFVGPDTLWACGDYVLYLARNCFNEYDYFWLCEYDVLINRSDVSSMFMDIDALSDHDFITSYFGVAEHDWWWRSYMEGQYKQVFRSFFPLIRVSARAIDFLFERRVEASQATMRVSPPGRTKWPNDEVFVATTLANNGFRCCDFNELGRYYTNETFNSWSLFHPTQISPNDGLIYHSVRRGVHYLKGGNGGFKLADLQVLLAQTGVEWTQSAPELQGCLQRIFLDRFRNLGDNPARVFDQGLFRNELGETRVPEVAVRSLILVLAQLRMAYCIEYVRKTFIATGAWPDVELAKNVALGKPAWQSSVCAWSKSMDARRDAEGANNGLRDIDYGFHTDREQNPWWAVDLQNFYEIGEIRVFNRQNLFERLGRFSILASLDGIEWSVVYEGDVLELENGNGDAPINICFQDGVIAKCLKIQISGCECLHLREFEAYGSELSLERDRPGRLCAQLT